MARTAAQQKELDDLRASLAPTRGRSVAQSQELALLKSEVEPQQPVLPVTDVSDIGAVKAGIIAVGKGFTTVGRAAQRGFAAITGDEEAGATIKARAKAEEKLFAPLAEARPIATFIGEVLGESAAFPVGGVGTGLIKRGATAAVSGLIAGAASEVGRGEDVGMGAALGAVFGPLGESFGALVNRFGGPAIDALKKLINKAAPGVNADTLVSPQGAITEQGENLLGRLNITRNEFLEAFGSLTDASKVQGLKPEAQLRVARAQAEGVPLSQGQATREFEIQSAEDILKGLEGREGEAARLFFNNQQEALVKSKDSFLQKLGGDLEITRTEAGGQARARLRDINAVEKVAVSNLYAELAELPGGQVAITTETYRNFADELIREVVPSSRIQRGIKNIFNDFSILEEVKVTPTSQDPLNFKNAEKMRQRLNKLSPDNPADITVVSQLKQGLDDLIAGATEQFPVNSEIAIAARKARKAAANRFQKFSAKDIIEDLTSFKKGTTTERIPDELVLDRILASGNKKVDNLKRVKRVLMTKPTTASRKAWEQIQTQAVVDIFGKAVTETPQGFVISGAKLNSAINRFGDEALAVVLRPKQLSALKQIQATIADATIPVPRTTNPSGTGQRILNAMNRLFTAPGLTGKLAAFISAGSNALKDQAERTLVLEGIEKGASNLQRSRGFLQLAASVGLRSTLIEVTERE